METTAQPILSPLRLDKYFLKELHFGLHSGFDRGRTHENPFNVPNLKVEVVAVDRNSENLLQWRFELSLELLDPEDGDFPYKIAAIVVGYFTVAEEIAEDRAERLAKTNGPALLYSSAREMVASVTGRSSFRPLLIPAVTFIQPVKAEAKSKVKALPPAKSKRAVRVKRASKKKSN